MTLWRATALACFNGVPGRPLLVSIRTSEPWRTRAGPFRSSTEATASGGRLVRATHLRLPLCSSSWGWRKKKRTERRRKCGRGKSVGGAPALHPPVFCTHLPFAAGGRSRAGTWAGTGAAASGTSLRPPTPSTGSGLDAGCYLWPGVLSEVAHQPGTWAATAVAGESIQSQDLASRTHSSASCLPWLWGPQGLLLFSPLACRQPLKRLCPFPTLSESSLQSEMWVT